MLVSSIQIGWQSASCYGPGNAALAAHECAAASITPAKLSATPRVQESAATNFNHAQDRSSVRPFWQYLEDSNNRDRLERAAILSVSTKPENANPHKAARWKATAQTPLPTPQLQPNAKAQAAYSTPTPRQTPARLIDVVA